MIIRSGESKSGIAALLAAAGVQVTRGELPAGDCVVSDRLIVERRTGADLAASLKDRRLFEQIERPRAPTRTLRNAGRGRRRD